MHPGIYSASRFAHRSSLLTLLTHSAHSSRRHARRLLLARVGQERRYPCRPQALSCPLPHPQVSPQCLPHTNRALGKYVQLQRRLTAAIPTPQVPR